MTDQQQASGRDLARQALAAYKATQRGGPPARPGKARHRTVRTNRSGGRDPVGFGAVLEQINGEQGWSIALGGGNILDQWASLCPQFVGRVEPVSFDADSGRLDLRPGSPAYAAQLRLLGGAVAKQINDKLGKTVVRTIRILTVGALKSGTVEPEPCAPAPTAPVRTRDTASPGYQRALQAHLENHRATPAANPLIGAAIARQNQALAAHREPEDAFTDAVAEMERLTGGQPADALEASFQAALRYKYSGRGREPQQVFKTA